MVPLVSILAIILIATGTPQFVLGFLIMVGKFNPLLPKERKKLPAKVRKKAKLLNGISIMASGVLFCILGVGLLLNSEVLMIVAAAMMALLVIIVLPIGLMMEEKYFN